MDETARNDRRGVPDGPDRRRLALANDVAFGDLKPVALAAGVRSRQWMTGRQLEPVQLHGTTRGERVHTTRQLIRCELRRFLAVLQRRSTHQTMELASLPEQI